MTRMVSRPPPRRSASIKEAQEFETLLREHVPVLFRCAYRWTGAVDRAEDLVQELLVRLYPRLDELRQLQRLRPWAMRVMYRIFVDELRRQRSSPVQFGLAEAEDAGDEADEAFIDPGADPLQLADQQLAQERIVAVWAHLSDDHRVLLTMHDIEDYSLPELAQIIDVPLGTLKSRLHRARARLRHLLLETERFEAADRVSIKGGST
jgi:RNA polymerase sigma factor (sigma-70 family)